VAELNVEVKGASLLIPEELDLEHKPRVAGHHSFHHVGGDGVVHEASI
jgi:hypothetical protein